MSEQLKSVKFLDVDYFEIQKYYQNELEFNTVCSRHNLNKITLHKKN